MSSADDADAPKPTVAVRALDHHAHANRWRDRHPAEKLALTAGLTAAALGGAPFVAPPLAIVAAGVAVWRAGIPLRAFVAALAVPAGFILTGAPMLMLGVDDGGVHFFPDRTHDAAALILRGFAASAALILLALTTPISDLARLLGKAHLPTPLIDVILLTYRLIFIVAECAQNIRHAQAARLGYQGTARSARSLGLLASVLLARSLAQARALELGLAARGLDGGFPMLGRAWTTSPAAWVAIGATVTAILALGWAA